MLLENIVPITLQQRIEAEIGSGDFAWFYCDQQTEYNKGNVGAGFQLCHWFYKDEKPMCQYFDLVSIIVHMFEERSGIRVKEFRRIKGNLLVNNKLSDVQIVNNIHTDICACPTGKYPRDLYPIDNQLSLIYYVNDSDGDTFVWEHGLSGEAKTFSPKRGNLVYFPSNLLHRPSQPVINQRRMVINFNIGI